jgi:hypothetical protein
MSAKQNITAAHQASYHRPMSRIWLGIFGAPVAWVIQMSLIEPIAAYTCYPHQVPLSAPLWADLPFILATISLACLAGGLFSGYIALDSWRRTGDSLTGALQETQIIEVDEGQTRFLAMLGMMSSFLFIVAILFTSCAVLLVSPCSAWT